MGEGRAECHGDGDLPCRSRLMRASSGVPSALRSKARRVYPSLKSDRVIPQSRPEACMPVSLNRPWTWTARATMRHYWVGLALNPFCNVFNGLPSVELVTVTLPFYESFSFLTFSAIFQDFFHYVPFPRRDFHPLNLLSVEPSLYGFFHSVFELIPSDIVRVFDRENFFGPIRFIPSVEGLLCSQYSCFLTFLDRNQLFFSFQLFRGNALIQVVE